MLQIISKIILLTKQYMALLVHKFFNAAVGNIVRDPQDKRYYLNINAKEF